jgi:DegV family protein with EDD domain
MSIPSHNPARVRVLADSAADIEPEVAKALGIVVVPFTIHFGDTVFTDGVDMDAAKFYRTVRERSDFPRTSQPAIGLYEEAFRNAHEQGYEVVSIHISRGLSGSFDGASSAARNVPEATVHVVDSRLAAMAQGLVVIMAAKMAAQGETAENIVAAVESMRDRTQIAIMIDSPTYLYRGGRIGRAQSMLGSMLSIKPIVGIEDGVVAPRLRARTAMRAVQAMYDLARSLDPLQEVLVLHSNAPQLVDEFCRLLKPIYGDPPVGVLGPVVGTHVGEGCIAIAMVQAETR